MWKQIWQFLLDYIWSYIMKLDTKIYSHNLFIQLNLSKPNLTKPNFCVQNTHGYMVFNATFNNISVITWQLVLLMERIGLPGENHKDEVVSHWQTLTHNVVSSTPRHEWENAYVFCSVYAYQINKRFPTLRFYSKFGL